VAQEVTEEEGNPGGGVISGNEYVNSECTRSPHREDGGQIFTIALDNPYKSDIG
jgi:hypothetical protein